MLVIPLLPGVTGESVAGAIRELDVDALIFLKSIRALRFRHLGDQSNDLEFAVEVMPVGVGAISFGDEEAAVDVADVRIVEPAGANPAPWWRRYSTRRTVAPGEKRSNKATATTTPISVCVPMEGVRPLRLYDRMPLPVLSGLTIGLNAQFDPDSARSTLRPNEWNDARLVDLGRLVAWSALKAFAGRYRLRLEPRATGGGGLSR